MVAPSSPSPLGKKRRYCESSTVASSGGNGSSGAGNSSSNASWCSTEDCESSVTMRIRCRRLYLLVVLPLLLIISIIINGRLLLEHSKTLDVPDPLVTSDEGGSGDDGGGGGDSASSSSNEDDDNGDNAGNKTHAVAPPDGEGDTADASGSAVAVAAAAAAVPAKTNLVDSFFGPHGRGRANVQRRNARLRRNAFGIHRQQHHHQVDDVPPTPSSLEANATFSACLLIKDDNEILNEWIAYHYHTLRMRHLIVAVDPTSSESPHDILRNWRNLTADLEIMEWNDNHFMPVEFLQTKRCPKKYMQKREDFDGITHQALIEISNHRYRQRVFLAKCMKALRQKGNSWVMHIDTDEAVVASKLLRQMKPDYLHIPPMSEPGSVLSLLQQTVRKTAGQVSYPCISMLRVLFGSVEMPAAERFQDVPAGWNATTFETLRWRHHALPHNMTYHGNPKVILDVSAIPESHMPDLVYSIHRPVPSFCHKNKELSFTNFRRQPIAVNHYLGSWERYSGRKDKRRSREVYEAKANVNRGKDEGVRPWLQGFVNHVGPDVAAALLGQKHLLDNA